MDPNNNLFSASLESIDSSKRVEKFQRFFTNFQRECEVTLNNAQEWIKAELPIVANYIELAPLKEELNSNKTSVRRKHLLSALIFEQAARDAVRNHQAATAGLMAIHMLNHVWQAKLEMNAVQVTSAKAPQAAKVVKSKPKLPAKSKAEQDHDLKREQILTSLIKKGEQNIRDSQLQKQNNTSIQSRPTQQPAPKKKNLFTKSQKDLWTEAAEKEKLNRLKTQGSKNATNKKKKRKANGMFSKVRTKFPLKRKSKNDSDPLETGLQNDSSDALKKPSDSLLDNPNSSAIMVSSGLFKDIDDSLIQARPQFPDDPNETGIRVRKVMKKQNQENNPNDSMIQSKPRFSDNPNESGITVRKMLKKREQATHEPGSNTIIMKLASSSGSRNGANQSVPEQCQQAVNRFYQQFPGYDIVAIRHLAAEKVGVSPQYIENLNILPERS